MNLVDRQKQTRLHDKVETIHIPFLNSLSDRVEFFKEYFGKAPYVFRTSVGTERDYQGCDIIVANADGDIFSMQVKDRDPAERSNHPRAGKDIPMEILRGYYWKNDGDLSILLDGGRDLFKIPFGLVQCKTYSGKHRVVRDWLKTETKSDFYFCNLSEPYCLLTRTQSVKRIAKFFLEKFISNYKKKEGYFFSIQNFLKYNDVSKMIDGFDHVQLLARKEVKDVKLVQTDQGVFRANIFKINCYIEPDTLTGKKIPKGK